MGKSRQQLIQEYEDAKLALLLDEYAEIYGKVSADLYEKDVADGKAIAVSEQDQETQLNEILRRAEADERKEARKGTRFKGVVRKITTVAAAIAIVFLMMVSVQAAGLDVFGAIGRWTDNVFHFESRSELETDQVSSIKNQRLTAMSEIRKILVLHDFPLDLAPTWLPDGFSLLNMSFLENDDFHGLYFYLKNPQEDWLIIQTDIAVSFGSFGTEWFEKDGDNAESIISNGRNFYLFQNNGIWTCSYQSETCRITIADSRGKDGLMQIINSIGELNNE